MITDWDTEAAENLKNVVSLHEIISGIWVYLCVQWKILSPLWNYIYITESEEIAREEAEDELKWEAIESTIQKSRNTNWTYTTSNGYADSHRYIGVLP